MTENRAPETITDDVAAAEDERSAYEKAGAEELDPRCIPQNLDGPPPVGDEIAVPDYTAQDHASWRFLFERQMNLLPGRAGGDFLRGVELLGMTPERLPTLPELSRRLEQATGWRVARIRRSRFTSIGSWARASGESRRLLSTW